MHEEKPVQNSSHDCSLPLKVITAEHIAAEPRLLCKAHQGLLRTVLGARL